MTRTENTLLSVLSNAGYWTALGVTIPQKIIIQAGYSKRHKGRTANGIVIEPTMEKTISHERHRITKRAYVSVHIADSDFDRFRNRKEAAEKIITEYAPAIGQVFQQNGYQFDGTYFTVTYQYAEVFQLVT